VIEGCAPDLPPCIPANQRLHIDIEDKSSADIFQSLETTTAFITAAISADPQNKVLVRSFSLNFFITTLRLVTLLMLVVGAS